MKEFIDKDRYAKHLGIDVIEFSRGRAKAKMKIEQHHLNSMDTVHGGAVFSLADAVFSIASNSHEGIAMAINVSISFFKAMKEKAVIIAEAKEISLNSKLATYLVSVTDEQGELVAMFQGTVYRKNRQST